MIEKRMEIFGEFQIFLCLLNGSSGSSMSKLATYGLIADDIVFQSNNME